MTERPPGLPTPFPADDDWSGVTNRDVRRRLQNRLNQRAYRRRRQEYTSEEEQANNANYDRRAGGSDNSPTLTVAKTDNLPAPITCGISESQHSRCSFAPANIHSLMFDFEKRVLASYLGGSPNADLLIKLSRVNVLRAAFENALAMGMTADWVCEDDCVSMFSIQGPRLSEHSTSTTIPPSLRPTRVQKEIPHHPWLDVFPFPALRDNFIRAGEHLNDDDLCHDLTAFWDTRHSNATLLVWGVPWDPQNWEVTEEFARKWGFFLKGCPEILVSTNKWRQHRGEKLLVWKRFFGII